MSRLRALAIVALVGAVPLLVASPALAKRKKKSAAAAASSSSTVAKPGEQQASTKSLEEKLKKADAADKDNETTVLAPVKLNPNGPMTKDDKADRARDMEIARIKKILPKMRDPNVKADLMFQLAEAWWEKSRYIHDVKEMPPWQQAADRWSSCVDKKGRKACGPEPRPNTTLSEQYRSSAVDLYSQLVKNYKSYPRLDEVWFILGYNKMDLASQPDNTKAKKDQYQKEALAAYRTIITNYPKSKFVCDANVELGNYFFDNNQLNPARHAYEDGLRCDKTKTYATYKLAWCDYNAEDYTSAVKRFKDVISAAQKTAEKNHVRLKSEALRDLVLSFQKAGELDTAISYYTKIVGKEHARRYITNLANKYFDAGGYDYAVRIYRNYLSKNYPVDSSAPEWQTKIVLAYDKQGNRAQVRKEIETLVDAYGQDSMWWKAQKDPHAREIAINLIEESLYNLVTDYHQEAIKTKSVATYKLARDIYKKYLDHFPNTERSYAMRFYYAEILYALEEYQPAFDQYKKVAEDKGKQQDYKAVSAKDMLLAAEKLVDIEGGLYKVQIQDDQQKIDENKDKGGVAAQTIKAKVDKDKAATELTALEKQFVAAIDEYLQLVPKADDEAQVRLRAAVIFFDKAQYVEASNRFAVIIKNWPKDPSSASAAGLILEALEAKQEWAELHKRATEFSENKELLSGNDKRKEELKKKIPIYIEGSAFKLASIVNEKDKDYPKAAGMFRDFAKSYPTSKFTPIALYNSFIIYQNAKELDQAVEVGQELIASCPAPKHPCDSDEMRRLPGDETKLRPLIMPDLTFRMAKSYELMADFANAAKYYEQYMKDFPTEKSAPDAQFNAGLWYKGLGEYDKAIAAWDKYIKIYDTMKKTKPAKDFEALKLYSNADVAWQEAMIYEDEKIWPKTIKALTDYVAKYGRAIEPFKALNATYHQLLAFKAMNKPKDVDRLAKEIVGKCSKLSDADKKLETMKLACAHSLFITLEPKYTAYSAMKFKSDRTLKADLDKFKTTGKGLSADYLEVVKVGNGDWAIAALVRIAQVPRLLAKAIRESPVPRNLTADQKDMYKSQLEDIAVQIETPAVDLLETAMKKSFELGIYNDWTLQAEQALAEFKPDLFIEPKELPLKGSEFFFTAHTPATPTTTAGSGGD